MRKEIQRLNIEDDVLAEILVNETGHSIKADDLKDGINGLIAMCHRLEGELWNTIDDIEAFRWADIPYKSKGVKNGC